MKKNFIIKVLIAFAVLIDMAAISAALLLEFLSGKKMGVMRYLVFISREFQEGWFSPIAIKTYGTILMISIIFMLSIGLYNILKLKKRGVIGTAVSGVILSVICYYLLNFNNASDFKAYYFFILALFIIIISQHVILILNLLRDAGINDKQY